MPDDSAKATDAPTDDTHAVQGGYGERTAPTSDAEAVEKHAQSIEGHATRAPDSAGISPPRPRRPTSDGPQDAPEDP
jgi:hypothetical protein